MFLKLILSAVTVPDKKARLAASHTPYARRSRRRNRWKVAHKKPSRPSPDVEQKLIGLLSASRNGPKIEIVSGAATPSAAGPNLFRSRLEFVWAVRAEATIAQVHCERPGESTRNARREPILTGMCAARDTPVRDSLTRNSGQVPKECTPAMFT